MKTEDFKVGSHVYYFERTGETFNTIPARVKKVHNVMLTIVESYNDGFHERRVKKSYCELQTKSNIILLNKKS